MIDERGKRTGKVRLQKIHKTLEEGRRSLTASQFAITRRDGTDIKAAVC
jgi:hypothetical protein